MKSDKIRLGRLLPEDTPSHVAEIFGSVSQGFPCATEKAIYVLKAGFVPSRGKLRQPRSASFVFRLEKNMRYFSLGMVK